MIKLKKISENVWEIPKSGKMNVPGRIFANEKLIEAIKKDKTLEQVKNVACLPGILKYSIACPDAHQGYGFSIGGVGAFDLEKGVISPGGVGYDINCSVRLLRTNITKEELEKIGVKEIIHSLNRTVPSGVGKGSKVQLTRKDLDEVLEKGAVWAVEKGYGEKEDHIHSEEGGMIKGCNPDDVSKNAKDRGIGQLGSLGAGNHFLELQVVDKIFDKEIAKKFGLVKGMVSVMIHCGSRGLGHQVASDYIKKMEEKYGHPDFDRELVNAPIGSTLGKNYLSAMGCAANFAFANKQVITHLVRENMKHYFPKIKMEVVYDVCHNIAKIEEHVIEGEKKKVLVARKGATRSFGPGRIELPERYRSVGQPVIIPGTMGTGSYVLVGTKEAEELTFGSTAHGAGRLKSRTEARKTISPENVKKDLDKKGIYLEAGSKSGISEEAPESYKDVEEVVKVSDDVGIGKLVARLTPIGVIKG